MQTKYIIAVVGLKAVKCYPIQAMNSVGEIWNGIMSLLSKDLSQTALDTWFSSAELVDLDNNNAVICAANDLAKQVISERFSARIKNALNELFCADYNIIVISGREGKEKYNAQKEGREGSRPSAIPAYRFEDYIIGETNRFAYMAVRAAAKRPGDRKFNPLYIHGPSGIGKTHLLCSAGIDIHDYYPGKRVLYIKGEEFTNRLVKAVKSGRTEQFHEEMRNVDVLLVDGVDFIAGKQATQEEFFNTFNSIYESGGQIIITADRAPKDLPLLEDRLRSRFEGGIVAEILQADSSLRKCYVQTKARSLGLELSCFDIEKISTAPIGSIRQLGGVLNNLGAYKSVLGYVPAENVNRAINTVADLSAAMLNPEKIITETARYFEVSESELRSCSRARIPSKARRISMYLMRTELKMRTDEIGIRFGRDNTAVLSAISRIESAIKNDAELKEAVNHIMSKAKGTAA